MHQTTHARQVFPLDKVSVTAWKAHKHAMLEYLLLATAGV